MANNVRLAILIYNGEEIEVVDQSTIVAYLRKYCHASDMTLVQLTPDEIKDAAKYILTHLQQVKSKDTEECKKNTEEDNNLLDLITLINPTTMVLPENTMLLRYNLARAYQDVRTRGNLINVLKRVKNLDPKKLTIRVGVTPEHMRVIKDAAHFYVD